MKQPGKAPSIRHTRIVEKICPFCGHNKAFTKRGENCSYKFKCSKCKRYID